MRFTGFRRLCEQDGTMPPAPQDPGQSKPKPKHDFEKSNMDGVLARDLNIVPKSNDGPMDMIAPGSGIEFKGKHLKRLNDLLGIEGHDVAMKLIRVLQRNDYGVQIEDVSGGCDSQGLNTGREYGPLAGRPFPHMACSPTNGHKWWISAKDWDNIRMPLPPGGGGGAGGPGGMGGPPGGGMGGGGGPPPPPGAGEPAPGGGPPPPPV